LAGISLPISAYSQNCESNFEFSVQEEISPLTYQFQENCFSNTPIIKYSWDFGDGSTSAKQNPEHQFLSDSVFLVSLTILTADSCSSTHSDSIHISKLIPPTCMAYFTFIRMNQATDYTYAFTDHSVPTYGDTISTWLWNFGDFSQSNAQNPIHQYSATGNYNVHLSISTKQGCSSSYSFVINIFNGNSPCQASFTYSQDTSGNLLQYHFHDNSSHSTTITSWKWFFDDGDSSILQDPNHVFPFAGIYFVKLKINTAGGCSSEITFPIKIADPKTYNVWGRVYAGQYVIDKCIAYLYKEYYNNYYKAVDTVRLTSINDTLGVYYFFQVSEGNHKVKVLLPNTSTFSDDYAPTYFGDNARWPQGNTLYLFQDISLANINLENVIPSVGHCMISGNINSTNTNISTLAGIELLLYKNSGAIADYAFTDAQGNFAFDELAPGLYSVSGEITGLYSNMINLNFNQDFDTISNLIINLSNTSITGFFIRNEVNNFKFSYYPNPVENILNIEFDSSILTDLNIQISSMDGRLINQYNITKNSPNLIQISTANIVKGVYLLKLYDLKSKIQKVVKFVKI